MRPTVKFLGKDLTERIVAEARDLICELGVEIHNPTVVSLLSDHGARIDTGKKRVHFTHSIIDKSLETAPESFQLYDSLGKQAVDLSEYNVNFTPGSAAINILDNATEQIRKPVTADYVAYVKLVCRMNHIASQSTAMIPCVGWNI